MRAWESAHASCKRGYMSCGRAHAGLGCLFLALVRSSPALVWLPNLTLLENLATQVATVKTKKGESKQLYFADEADAAAAVDAFCRC